LRWQDRRVLIFTEYEDTQRYLVQQLRAACAHTENAAARIGVFHGPTSQVMREELKRTFNAPPVESTTYHCAGTLVCQGFAAPAKLPLTRCTLRYADPLP